MRKVCYIILLGLLSSMGIINFYIGDIFYGFICVLCGFTIFTVTTWYLKNIKNKMQEITVCLFYLFYIFLLISEIMKDFLAISNVYIIIVKSLSAVSLLMGVVLLFYLFWKKYEINKN